MLCAADYLKSFQEYYYFIPHYWTSGVRSALEGWHLNYQELPYPVIFPEREGQAL